jgi:ABC-type Fe3+-siderophore transport system permease subunit
MAIVQGVEARAVTYNPLADQYFVAYQTAAAIGAVAGRFVDYTGGR